MQKKVVFFWLLISVIYFVSGQNPPVAQEIPYKTVIHGVSLDDEFHWLKDKSRKNPAALQYIDQENEYTDFVMSGLLGLQDSLYNEFRSRLPENDISVPCRIGDYWYYSREQEGSQYSIYCRKRGSLAAPEEIYLDLNVLAENRDYLQIGDFKLSPDGKFLAYLADYNGSEFYTLYVKNLLTNTTSADTLQNVDDICWANDNETLFYCTTDAAGRTDKVWRHRLGDSFDNDDMIYEEKNEAFYTYVYATKNRRYIIVGTASKTSSEIRFLPASQPWKNPKLVTPRLPDIQYYLYHHENNFFIYTNENALNYKLMVTPEDKPAKENWQVFLPHRDNVTFDLHLLKDYLIFFETENYQDKIRIMNIHSREEDIIFPPNDTAKLFAGSMPEYESTKLRYRIESMQSPWQIFEYDLQKKQHLLLKEQPLNGFNKEIYQAKRLYATAEDGEKIPVSLVYNSEIFRQNGSHPLLLSGYGAYGDNSDPYFSVTKLSLLDRGFCWAIAHVRGGGEMGSKWYEAGKMMNKMNTFTDFIACSEFLIANDFTSPQLLTIEGASAGGLLIATVTNRRPELFKVAIGDVPFVDLINTMLDPSLSATVSEYEEWGDPMIKEQFEYMLSYCPYYNVIPQDYPNIMLTGGFYDPRVNFWEPAKLAAKIRKYKTDNNTLLLKIYDTGHGGSSGRYDYLKEIALQFAFIIDKISTPAN
jgi:oligopeptidase B